MPFVPTSFQRTGEASFVPCVVDSAFKGEQRRKVMAVIGIDDPYIWGGYAVAIILAIVCAVYGLLMWNKEGAETEEEDTEGEE